MNFKELEMMRKELMQFAKTGKSTDEGYFAYLREKSLRAQQMNKALACVPAELKAKVRKEFKEWTAMMVGMIYEESSVEQGGGPDGYQFILPNSLVSIVAQVIQAEQHRMAARAEAEKATSEQQEKDAVRFIAKQRAELVKAKDGTN